MVKEVQDGWSEEEYREDKANEYRQDAEDGESFQELVLLLDAQTKEDLIKGIMEGGYGQDILEYLGYYE